MKIRVLFENANERSISKSSCFVDRVCIEFVREDGKDENYPRVELSKDGVLVAGIDLSCYK